MSDLQAAIIALMEGVTFNDLPMERFRQDLRLHMDFMYTGGNGMGMRLIKEEVTKKQPEE